MTGEEIYNRYLESGGKITGKKMSRMLDHLDEQPENITVLAYLLNNDVTIIENCENADDLSKKVLAEAEREGQYGGLEYWADDFLDPDDENFSAPDDGLSWVTFGDIWDAIEQNI